MPQILRRIAQQRSGVRNDALRRIKRARSTDR